MFLFCFCSSEGGFMPPAIIVSKWNGHREKKERKTKQKKLLSISSRKIFTTLGGVVTG